MGGMFSSLLRNVRGNKAYVSCRKHMPMWVDLTQKGAQLVREPGMKKEKDSGGRLMRPAGLQYVGNLAANNP